MLEFVVSPVQAFSEETGNDKWVEALPARTYKTSMYGEVPITMEKLDRMVKNFKTNVRGQEIAIDFEHGTDRAKGNQAAGWYKDFDIRPSTSDPSKPALFALVNFTDDAKKEISDGKWKYFSLEWEDEWEDTDGNKYVDVVTGGGITNRPIAKKTLPINFSETMLEDVTKEELLEVKAESKEMEHSEPGTGTPPAPRTDEDGSDDIAIKEGWRRFSPPDQDIPLAPSGKSTTNGVKGGSKVSEFAFAEKDARELFHVLNLDSDTEPAKVVETIKVKFGELDTLRESAQAHDQEKVFAEQYPQYWNEHKKLMERDRENTAKTFAEGVSRIRKTEGYSFKETKQGLSVEALNKITELHKKFAEGDATLEMFEECIKTIVNGGIVAFGEVGSSTSDDDIPEVDMNSATGIAQSRKLFAELIQKIQKENPEMEYTEAIAMASKKHPDLAEAYSVTLPG